MRANHRYEQQQDAFGTCPTGPSLLRSLQSTVSYFMARSESLEKPECISWLKASTARLVAWLDSCADAYATAALYGELARLSDAELRRRGLARETLARDVSDIGGTKRRPADAAE